MQGWIDLFRSLGESLLEVLRAELSALKEDFTRSGRSLGLALALFGGAAALGFWIVGLLIFVLVALLSIWLQTWAAALIVLAVFAIVAGVLVKLGLRHLREVENPVESVQRRVDDHLAWWQSRLLAETEPVDVVPAATVLEEDLP